MKEKISLKKEIIKVIFYIISVVASAVIVGNMVINSFNDCLKKDTLDKIRQYAQLASFTTEKLIKESSELTLTDKLEPKLNESLKVLQSGEIAGIDDVIDDIEYRIYDSTEENKKIIISSYKKSDNIDDEILEWISKTSEDGKIKSKQTSDNKLHAFAPIKVNDEKIIGVVEIISENHIFSNVINNQANLFFLIISIVALIWGILKIMYILNKNINKEKKYQKVLLITFIISILGILIILNSLDFNLENLKSNQLNFKEISDSVSDNNGNIYLTDTANTRILKINKDNELEYSLIGNKKGKGKFFYAVSIESDNEGNLYVLNNTIDERGSYIAKEEILKYSSKGEFLKTIYSKEYKTEEMPLKKGIINSIKTRGDYLYIFENQGNNIEVLSYKFSQDEVKKELKVNIQCDSNLIIDTDLQEKEKFIVVSTKNGEIFRVDKDNNKEVLISSLNNSKFVPSEIEVDNKGSIYCLDNGSRSILKIEDNNIKTILNPEILKLKGININTDPRLEHGYYRFSINNSKITTSEHAYLINVSENQMVQNCFNHIKLSKKTIVLKIIGLFLICLAVMSIIYFIHIKFKNINKSQRINPVFKECIYLVLIISVISICISGYFINGYQNAFQNEIQTKLKRISFLKSKTIDGDIVSNIKNVNQYMGKDYIKIREESKEGFNSFTDEWNLNYYSAIYNRVDDKINSIVYSDDTNLLLFPMLFTNNDSKNIFRRVLDYGSVEYTIGTDFQGEWLSGFSPIRDSKDNIVAVLEIGADGNYYRIQIHSIIKDIIINIISIIAVLVFFFIEINIFMGLIFEGNKNKILKYDVNIIRFMSFLIYAIMNIPLFFIPIVMKNLLSGINFFNISQEIATGLPLTAQMISLVIASGVGGTISDKSGWRPVFVSGILLMMIGSFGGGIANTPILFIMANALIGFGLGLASVSAQSFIFYASGLQKGEFDTNEVLAGFNSGSYAGANCGILFGSMIAEKVGFSNAFFLGIIVGIIPLILVFKIMPNLKNNEKESSTDNSSKKELIKSLCDYQMINFAILVLLPIIIVSFFVVHFFPIYGDIQGISSTTAGLGYMLQGITVIYLGPTLTKFAIKYLKPKKTVILSGLIAFGGIILFGCKPTIGMAFITIFILGISEAVGQSARVNYFLNLKATKKLGEGKSLAIFSVFENLGTIVGPTIFALILSSNVSVGMSLYGGISLILTAIFAINTLNLRKKLKMIIVKTVL